MKLRKILLIAVQLYDTSHLFMLVMRNCVSRVAFKLFLCLFYVIYSYVLDKDGDVPAAINVDDNPSSPSHISGVNKTAGSNYGSVPKERRSRFPMPSIGKYL